MTSCTICRDLVPGRPGDDVLCPVCEEANFAGMQTPEPRSLRRARTTRPLRPLKFIGVWTWSAERGIEEIPDGH